jgi:HD-like signal output (HDOD) protein
MQFTDLLRQAGALPSVPQVAARLIESFESDRIDMGSIAQEIDKDPVLAGRILQQANSSFFRTLRPVVTVRDATAVLGLNKVRSLVLAAIVQETFKGLRNFDHHAFWHYSMAAAALSRFIAEPLRLDGDIAFTTGLLHGVGELVMQVGMPEDMLTFNHLVSLLDVTRGARQQDAFGYSYAEVGAELVAQWKLPSAMVESIRHHVLPLERDDSPPLAAVLHLAAWRARVFVAGNQPDVLIYSYPDTVGLLLDLDPDWLVTPDLPVLSGLLQ